MTSLDLDIDLALRRVECDHKLDRAFVTHPYEMSLVGLRRAEWVATLEKEIADGSYNPGPAFITNVPKGRGLVRQGALLTLADQVVYAAAVGAILPHINNALRWSTPPKDYAYRIRNIADVDLLAGQYRWWTDFRLRSLALLDAGAAVVASTDITGFYENVDHEILISDLRSAGSPDALNNLISRCLGRWCVLNKRGLPQSNTASHILAKLYLTPVDHALTELGFEHVRYVDDTRIFCSGRGEARRALLQLSVLLRERGLTLQSAKTKFYRPGDARRHFEGTVPVITPLAKHYAEEIARQVGMDPKYMTVTEAERLVMKDVVEIPAPMLRAAFEANFITGNARFEKSLFHFLILRLGRARDPFAVNHCLALLDEHPEETRDILTYLANVGAVSESESTLLRLMESPDAVYDYQAYQIIRWRMRIPTRPSEELLVYVRRLATASKTAPHLLAACRAFIGRFGSPADFDSLVRDYAAAASDLERCEVICGASKMESGRRNAFLGKAKADGFLSAAAVKGAREGHDWYPE